MSLRAGVAAAVGAALMIACCPAAAAPPARVPAAVPSAATPDIQDAAADAILEYGNRVLVGGAFTKVRDPRNGKLSARRALLAFARSTGRVIAGFAPALDGEVRVLAPGPAAGTVYVGGRFTTVNGQVRRKLALIRVTDGALVPSFAPPAFDGVVKDLAVVHGRLLVGGSFTVAGEARRGGLASLHPTTGKLDGYLHADLADRHHGQSAKAPVGAENLAVSPDRRHLVVIGNFRRVGGVGHRQVARFDLTPDRAALRPWSTTRFTSTCLPEVLDFWVRDVAFSPDSKYFVVVTTGGGIPNTICDTASRWEAARSGANQQPTWVAFSGGDTLLSTAVGPRSIFVGGHFRYLNNPLGNNEAKPGAVGRASIAAIDPASGLPQRWNPGRNPRGYGADELHLTASGLWVGGDTDFIGNREHRRGRVAFFPFSAAAPHAANVAALPGTVYQFGAATVARSYDGATKVGPARKLTVSGDWRKARGAFWVGGTLFYGQGATLYRRSFAAGKAGSPVKVDPYHDPKWDKAPTGSKTRGKTYAGATTSFYRQLPQVSGAFYRSGRLFYTLAGKSGLHWRWFDPDSGTVGAQETAVAGVTGLATIRGVFVAGSSFYSVAANGTLRRQGWSGIAPTGRPAVVSGPGVDKVDWRAGLAFVAR